MAHKEPLTTDIKELVLIRQLLDDYLAGLATDADIANLSAQLTNSFNTVQTAINAITALSTLANRAVFNLDFWSIAQEEAQIPAVAADVTLPSVTISGLPSGFQLVRIAALFKFRACDNVAVSANKLSGTQYIQCSPNQWVWTNAIDFSDDMFGVAASTREGGDLFVGSRDLKTLVSADGTMYFKWAQARADAASLNFNDVQTGLRIYFR